MAKDSLPEQRTEMPTDRRLQEIRKEGALFHSTDLEHAAVLVAGFLAVSFMWNVLYVDMKYMLVRSFGLIAQRRELEPQDLINGFFGVVKLFAPDIFIVTACVATIAALSVFLQTKWNRREKWLKFRWDFLNPIQGVKRIFSIHGVTNVLKAIVKMAVVLPIGYWTLKGFAPQMVLLVHMSLADVLGLTGEVLQKVFWNIIYIFFVVGQLILRGVSFSGYDKIR